MPTVTVLVMVSVRGTDGDHTDLGLASGGTILRSDLKKTIRINLEGCD